MGQVTHVAEPLGIVRRREFRLYLFFSVLAHAALLFALSYRPSSPAFILPGVVAVELVAAPPGAAPAPRPAPKPAPVEKKVVLPKEPSTPKVKPKPAEKPPPPKPAEKDLDDVLADLRADAGEPAPEQTAAAAPAALAGGIGQPVPPEVAAWIKAAKIHVRNTWVLTSAFRTQMLETHVVVELDAQGNVLGEPRIVRRSGNPWYDEGVVRAIQKASPLPPPPAADEWAFVFVPQDSF